MTTNQNSAIVIDSDRTSKNKKINETKDRVKKEFGDIGGFCWITKGKEIENYIPAECIEKKFAVKAKQVGQYDKFPEYIKKYYKSFESNKVSFAKSISEYITAENSKGMLDLEFQIRKLYATIQKWNRK